MSNKAVRSNDKYSAEFKAELIRRYTAYKEGSERSFTAVESKKRIQKLLKAARK